MRNPGYYPSMNVYNNSYNNYNPLNMGYQVNSTEGINGDSNGNNNFQEENFKKKISSNILKNLED